MDIWLFWQEQVVIDALLSGEPKEGLDPARYDDDEMPVASYPYRDER